MPIVYIGEDGKEMRGSHGKGKTRHYKRSHIEKMELSKVKRMAKHISSVEIDDRNKSFFYFRQARSSKLLDINDPPSKKDYLSYVESLDFDISEIDGYEENWLDHLNEEKVSDFFLYVTSKDDPIRAFVKRSGYRWLLQRYENALQIEKKYGNITSSSFYLGGMGKTADNLRKKDLVKRNNTCFFQGLLQSK